MSKRAILWSPLLGIPAVVLLFLLSKKYMKNILKWFIILLPLLIVLTISIIFKNMDSGLALIMGLVAGHISLELYKK